MKNIKPTTQPITDINKLINNSVKQIEYNIKDTELQNSILYKDGKKFKVIERILKDKSDGDVIVKIESQEEIIEKTIKELDNDVEQLTELIGGYVDKLAEMDKEIKILRDK